MINRRYFFMIFVNLVLFGCEPERLAGGAGAGNPWASDEARMTDQPQLSHVSQGRLSSFHDALTAYLQRHLPGVDVDQHGDHQRQRHAREKPVRTIAPDIREQLNQHHNPRN